MANDKLALDTDVDTARAVHRVVRAMHDGECPRCHILFKSSSMLISDRSLSAIGGDEMCPKCGFMITRSEQQAAIDLFGPIMDRNLDVFEAWRASLKAE